MNISVKNVRYSFTIRDEEIIEDSMLALSCDEDTWLYEPKRSNKVMGKSATGQSNSSHFLTQEMAPNGGGVNSLTYCRRRCPMFEVEDTNSNRSSLGLLTTSLNDSLTQSSAGPGKSSCGFTDSENVTMPPVFKLDSPLLHNPPAILTPTRPRYEISRMDSLDASEPLSLKGSFSLEDNAMTSSMVNFVNSRSKPMNALLKNHRARESGAMLTSGAREMEAMLTSVDLESMTGSVLLASEMIESTTSDTENVPPPPPTSTIEGEETKEGGDNRLADEIAPPADNCLVDKETLNDTYTMKRSLGGGDDLDNSPLNNKDMNRTYDLEFANRTNDLMNRTFTKSELNLRQGLPSRRSTFNSTFTKLLPGSTETLEDEDRGSNASVDSSCSTSSDIKPRSVEDLRAEAHRQQTVLNSANSTSTPENSQYNKRTPIGIGDWEVTPIVQVAQIPRCNTATITRPSAGVTKLRKPMQIPNSNTALNGHAQRFEPGAGRRPSTAAVPAPSNAGLSSGIPRPRPSRLPMPKFRSANPMVKKGGLQ